MNRWTWAVLLTAVLATPAEAIPAFARRYNLTCASCHDPMPRLNAFGERFAAQGFTLSADDTVGMTSLGDPLLMLNTSLPVALRFDAYARYVSGRGGQTDFSTPTTVKLMSGGQVARGVSYYIYVMLAERGAPGPVEDAWLTFREPVGVPADITIGQFQLIDPLWKRELRLTLEDYAIIGTRVGSAAANLTYDRGVLVGVAPTERTAIYGALVNGNGIEAAAGGTFDGDAPKTGVIIATQEVGPLRLGALGYYGSQRFVPVGLGLASTNRTRMVGPSIQTAVGNVDLGLQYLYRDDTNPDFLGPALTTTRGGFVEAIWHPRGRGDRLLVTGLYNLIQASRTGADYESATLNVGWLYARNLRLSAEATWDLVAERATFGLGVVTAF